MKIGRHINTSYGFVSAVKYAHDMGCEIMQVFLGPPQRISIKSKAKSELEKFGAELKKYNMEMVVHGSYAINFCHPVGSKRYETSIKALVSDLNGTAIIGDRCLGVVIHMGKNIKENNLTDEQAIKNYIQGLKQSLENTPTHTKIILETGASQGTEVGSKIKDLAKIYNGLTKNEKERIGFCIDTCHIWATGYDISNKNDIDNFFKIFDKEIGIKKITCIHFNDSKTALGSKVDRHADLGYGFIGSIGLKIFAKKVKNYKIPIIMETPLDAINPDTNKEITFAEEFAELKKWLKN